MIDFVTGGSGFIGSFVVEYLRAAGRDVVALARSDRSAAVVEGLGARPVVGDVLDADSYANVLDGVDTVYHIAAHVEPSGRYDDFYRGNVLATEALVEATLAAGVRKIVLASSASVYSVSNFNTGVPVAEDAPVGDCGRWNHYAHTKLAGERVVADLCAACDVPWAIARLGFVYGPRNRAFARYYAPVFLRDAARIIGRGDNALALVYVEDAAAAIVATGLAEQGTGVFNVAGTEVITQRQYMQALADGFGVSLPTRGVPSGVAYAVAALLSWGHRWGIVEVPLSRMAVHLMATDARLSVDRLRQLCGWQPVVAFEAGNRRTFQWYRQQR